MMKEGVNGIGRHGRPARRLVEGVRRALILCHTEDVSRLGGVLRGMGFAVEEVRQRLPAAQSRYCSQAKCLLGHHAAWRRVCEIGEPCVVIEADFVPVQNFAELPCPPAADGEGCCCWLYSSAQRIYRRESRHFASGQSATTVANFWTPAAAEQAMDFAEEEIRRHEGAYSPWDTYLRPGLKARGVPRLLIPWRSYGEHGGVGNLEHRRAGVNDTHRADVLYGPPSFLPYYARGSAVVYHIERARFRMKAVLRLLAGRYVEPGRFSDPSLSRRELAAIVWFGITRLVHGPGGTGV